MLSSQPDGQSSIRHAGASGTRILYAVMAAFIVLVVYFIAHGYYLTIKRSKQEILQRLHAISFSTAALLNGDEHQQLAARYTTTDAVRENTQDTLYNRLHNILAYVQEANSLETPVYTFVFSPADSSFHFIVTSAERPYYYHTYRTYPPALLQHYNTGGELDVYKDENGVWLSSFAPVRNAAGEVVALVQADQNFSRFLAKARTDLLWNALISVAILLPFGFLLVMYVSRLLRKQMEAQLLLHEQNEEIKTQHEVIEKHNHELDERVKRRTAQLQALNEELSGFLYHSSHDVQAPVATLKGLIALAEKELPGPVATTYLHRMCVTTDRLEKITKTIRLVHEMKMSELSLTPVALKDLVRRVVYFLEPPAENFSFNVLIPDAFSLVNDRKILHTIFHEILKNACQYQKQGDTNAPYVSVALLEETDEEVLIEIDDNGEGIDPCLRQDIFSMFKRGSERSYGMGMGLSIVRSCLEKIGGGIVLAEKESPGTKFILRLKKYKTTT